MAILTTLCYLEKDSRYLMMLRNKKRDDVNKGKWIGVGGKFESGETPEECLIREVREETGFRLADLPGYRQLSGRAVSVRIAGPTGVAAKTPVGRFRAFARFG